jgi:hypothetical protein
LVQYFQFLLNDLSFQKLFQAGIVLAKNKGVIRQQAKVFGSVFSVFT